jgi:hypothetical protein
VLIFQGEAAISTSYATSLCLNVGDIKGHPAMKQNGFFFSSQALNKKQAQMEI